MANTKSKPVPPDHTERYRELVVRLLSEKYDENSSALARDLGLQQSQIYRFARKGIGAVPRGEATARKLCDLAGEHYPLPSNSLHPTSQPPRPSRPFGRIATPPPPKIERNTLDKVLDLFEGRWLGATAAAAVASAPTIRDLRPEDWLGALADLDTVIKTWASKYQDHAIEDPISITPPPIPENEKSPSRRNNVRGQAS